MRRAMHSAHASHLLAKSSISHALPLSPLEEFKLFTASLASVSPGLRSKFDHVSEISPVALLALAKLDAAAEHKKAKLVHAKAWPSERLLQARRWLQASHREYGEAPAPGWAVVSEQRFSLPNSPAHRLYITTDSKEEPLIVLSIRGSASQSDVVTDLLVDTAPFHHDYGHGGMVQAGVALAQRYGPAIAELQKSSGAHVITTGHSLGAGSAATCAIELKHSFVDNVQSIGFGTPAAFGPELAKSSVGFITSFVNGDDFVPRLSEASVLRLHLRSLQVDIASVLLRDIEGTFHSWSLPASCPETHKERVERFKASVLGSLQAKLGSHGRETKLAHGLNLRLKRAQELVVPGEVILLSAEGAAWLVGQEQVKDISLSKSMVVDHLTSSYAKGLGLELEDEATPCAISLCVKKAVDQVSSRLNLGPFSSAPRPA